MSTPLRVAMTLTQDWHSVPGGTATAANALASAVADDARVDLVGVGPAGPRPGEPFTPPVPTESLGLRLPWLYDSWDKLRQPRVTSASGPVDLVHLTIPIACPRDRVPMVATVHDVLPLTMPEMFTRRGAKLMARGLGRIRDEAAIVMVPSELGAREFEAQGFDPSRLAVVPLGVDAEVAPQRSAVEAARRAHGLESDYVLFVGTSEPRKGLDVLIDAFERLDRPGLVLAVAGPSGWGEDMGPRLDALGERCRRLGFLESGELNALRCGSAVCCLPSRAEGFGLPVLEAMAAGAPVVTTEGTPMAEFAHGVAWLVPVGDSEALAQSLADVLDDPEVADAMRAEGVQRAGEYSWRRTAAAVVDVYDRVFAG
ncbi:MAG: glycosyltransferase family 4 protein [Actinomycetia bacterium]|nr:glycosyltransferase family 4 protein [Actinomycetes bacterium]